MIRAYGKKGSKLADIKDFLINWDYGEEQTVSNGQQSVEEMKRALMGIAKSHNEKLAKMEKVKKRKPIR